VPLKVFKRCSELAATDHFLKTECAVGAMYVMLEGTCRTSTVSAAAQTGNRLAAAVMQQLQKSKLLEQLPSLIRDAALQLQAVAGVWPASVQAADKARFEAMLYGCSRCGRHPGEFAEGRAYITYLTLGCIDKLLPVSSSARVLSSDVLLDAQHLVIASWQYLSTVLPDHQSGGKPSTGQGSAVPTAIQQQLAQASITIAMRCTVIVDATLAKDPSITTSTGAAPAGMRRTAGVMTTHAAVLSRHHVECTSFCMVILQLMLQIKTDQEPQESVANAGLGPAAQRRPPERAAGQVPAPLDRLLRQLGVSSSAAVWAATQRLAEDQSLQSRYQIGADLMSRTRRLLRIRDHSKAFLLNSSLPALSQPLLQELQQQLQLYLLLSCVLLQQVVDDPTSGGDYTFRCAQACNTAHSLNSFYQKVLYAGPASLHQHMPGHMQPQAELGPNPGRAHPEAAPPEAYMCLPADVHAGQLQLLGQLVPKLMQLWAVAVGIVPEGKPHAAASTDIHGSTGVGAGSSSNKGMSCNPAQMVEALKAVGGLVLNISSGLPGPQASPKPSQTGSSASAAAATAGQLCALLESLCRMEMAVDQHFSAMSAAGPSSSTRGGSSNMATHALCVRRVSTDLPGVLVVRGESRFALGPLVDPINVHSSPGSKPCKQLCSLLATMLKMALHDCCASSKERPAPVYGLVPLFLQDWRGSAASKASFLQSMFILDHPSMRVAAQVVCAIIDAISSARSTARQAVPSAGGLSAGGLSGRSSNAASPVDVSAMMSLLALLGRCCLLTSDAGIPSSHLDGFIAAGIRQKIGPILAASTTWLSAGSNAAQLEAMGYNTEGVLQCLQDAAAACTEQDGTDAAGEPLTVSQSARLSQQQQLVRAVGRALSSFAHPGACNNPACTTFSGPSEANLVQGSTSKCSSCRAARYCSKACQRAAWKQHRPMCKALTAAAPAATAEPAAGKGDAAV
jgi:hypothetical protein